MAKDLRNGSHTGFLVCEPILAHVSYQMGSKVLQKRIIDRGAKKPNRIT